MTPDAVPFVFRNAWLFILLAVAINIVYGRTRAAKLVAAGRLSEEELSAFVRGALILFGGTALGMRLIQYAAGASDPLCLMQFPPATSIGWVPWVAQLFLSAWLIRWVWTEGGDERLARLAPAFTSGPVLERSFAPMRVRYFITAVVILAPVGNIVVQLLSPMPLIPWCAAG